MWILSIGWPLNSLKSSARRGLQDTPKSNSNKSMRESAPISLRLIRRISKGSWDVWDHSLISTLKSHWQKIRTSRWCSVARCLSSMAEEDSPITDSSISLQMRSTWSGAWRIFLFSRRRTNITNKLQLRLAKTQEPLLQAKKARSDGCFSPTSAISRSVSAQQMCWNGITCPKSSIVSVCLS